MYLIIFHSLYLHLYWQGCNTETHDGSMNLCHEKRNAATSIEITMQVRRCKFLAAQRKQGAYTWQTPCQKKRNEKGKPLRTAIDCLLRSFTVCSSL